MTSTTGTPRKSTTRRTRSTRSTTAKTTTKATDAVTAVTPKVVTSETQEVAKTSETGAASAPAGEVGELRKKELIDIVVSRTDVKRKFAKPVIEELLEVLTESLEEGRELNLQPLGKFRVNRTTEKENGKITVLKLRQTKRKKQDPEAPSEETSAS